MTEQFSDIQKTAIQYVMLHSATEQAAASACRRGYVDTPGLLLEEGGDRDVKYVILPMPDKKRADMAQRGWNAVFAKFSQEAGTPEDSSENLSSEWASKMEKSSDAPVRMVYRSRDKAHCLMIPLAAFDGLVNGLHAEGEFGHLLDEAKLQCANEVFTHAYVLGSSKGAERVA